MNDVVLRFRTALGKHLGQTITPEIAMAIEMAVLWPPDESIDPSNFQPLMRDDYCVRVESFRETYRELDVLHRAHWLETEHHRHGIALNPDYEAMCMRERAGRLLQVTARHRGELVGQLRMFIGPSLHTQTTVAEEDALYVAPEHRGTWLAMKLIRYAEDCLIALGVNEIRANSKTANRADVLMRRMGYQQVAFQFVKIFSKENVNVL